MIPPIPEKSLSVFEGIDLSGFDQSSMQSRIDVFTQYDREHENGDPTNCKFLGKLPNGVVLSCAKLAIDADGIAADLKSRSGKEIDPEDGQNDTSYHIEGKALSSEKHPFFVLPLGDFRKDSGLNLGDLCVIIYNGCMTGAVFGDLGPWDKWHEASIFVHEGLKAGGAADPCRLRDGEGRCELIHDVSISGDVIMVGFPKSAITLTWDNAAEEIRQAAYALFAGLKSTVAQ